MAIQSYGYNTFRILDNTKIQVIDGKIMHGYHESSNVNINDNMIKMLFGYRYYEMTQRVLHIINNSIQLNTKS
jgi:flagellar basal body rod protein FlgG